MSPTTDNKTREDKNIVVRMIYSSLNGFPLFSTTSCHWDHSSWPERLEVTFQHLDDSFHDLFRAEYIYCHCCFSVFCSNCFPGGTGTVTIRPVPAARSVLHMRESVPVSHRRLQQMCLIIKKNPTQSKPFKSR